MRRVPSFRLLLAGVLVLLGSSVLAQDELTYQEYQALARTSIQIKQCAMYEPLDGEPGMYLVVGDRFSKLNVYRILPGGQRERVWTSRNLDGAPNEVLVVDLLGDGLDDSIVCRTARRIYIFSLDEFFNVYESQSNEFTEIRAFAVANVDNDPASEIVINADDKLQYLDGVSHVREFTSLKDYQATLIRCGDVTGDGNNDIVLNTGQVVEASSGEVVWEDQVFGTRLELLDLDGDGVLEVLTESDGIPLKVWDVDFKQEKRF